MACHETVFEFLHYCLPETEEAIRRGEHPVFEDAIPTEYDAFFYVAHELGVLDSFARLPDPRRNPAVPLPALAVLMVCRFLHCLQSFRRMGEILLRYHPLLQRIGFTPIACERGVYRSKRRRQQQAAGGATQVFDEERFSEVLRLLPWEVLNTLILEFVQHLRRRHKELFQRGLFVMDSNHYKIRGTGQEYKWCTLMLWTRKGMIPVWMEFSPVPGDGETTIGRRVLENALAAYGEGFIKHVLMDAGYLDGETLHWLKFEKGIDWTTKAKEEMQVSGWMRAQLREASRGRWRQVDPPKLNCAKAKLPVRRILWLENNPFPTYGAKVNGIVIWDHYEADEEHPQGRDEYQYVISSDLEAKGGEIHARWRLRWSIENAFGAMTDYWRLGKWQIRDAEVYRATVQFMALTYGLLVVYLTRKSRPNSLQLMADRFRAQAGRMILVRTERSCGMLTSEDLNRWLTTGFMRLNVPGP